MDGPVTGIVHNFNELSKNTACVYEAVAKMARSSIIRLNQMFQFVDNMRDMDPFQVSRQPIKTTPDDNGATNLTFPRMDALRKQIAWMKERVSDLEEVNVNCAESFDRNIVSAYVLRCCFLSPLLLFG